MLFNGTLFQRFTTMIACKKDHFKRKQAKSSRPINRNKRNVREFAGDLRNRIKNWLNARKTLEFAAVGLCSQTRAFSKIVNNKLTAFVDIECQNTHKCSRHAHVRIGHDSHLTVLQTQAKTYRIPYQSQT